MKMFVIIILSSLLLYLIYKKYFKPLNYWKQRGIPHKKPLPFIGNNLEEILGRMSFIDGIIKMHTDFINEKYNGYFQFMEPVLVVRDLELIRQITVKDFDHFMDHMTNLSNPSDTLLSNSLFMLKGQKWKDMRSTLSPAFTSSKLKGMYNLIYDIGEQFVRHFQENGQEQVVEMKDAFARFANDVIATTAFGLECNSMKYKDNEFYLMGDKLTDFSGVQILKFILNSIAPGLMEFFNVPALPTGPSNFFRKVIKKNIENREKCGIVRPDIIHLLLEARKGKLMHEQSDVREGFATVEEFEKSKKGKLMELDDEMIAAQAVFFFFAGFDTVSSALSFAAYELALNPDIQERLCGEIDEAMEKMNEKISYDELLKLEYLDMVVSETLRKWPAGAILDRKCVKDLLIEPKNGKKPFLIEKGCNVVIPMLGLHRDERYYKDPEKFDPERFSLVNRSNIEPYSYIPFGIGPRACIGSRLALLEMKIVLCLLLSKFTFTVVNKTPIPLEFELNSLNMKAKNGMWLGLKARKP